MKSTRATWASCRSRLPRRSSLAAAWRAFACALALFALPGVAFAQVEKEPPAATVPVPDFTAPPPAGPMPSHPTRLQQDTPPPAPPAELTKRPKLIRSTPAPYPAKALAEGRTAVVVLQLDVDAAGKVTDAKVVAGAGPEFDDPALLAVKSFEFEPAEAGGKAVPVRITYRYRFEIDTTKKLVDTAAPAKPAEAKVEPVSFEGELKERGTRTRLVGARVFVTGQAMVARTDAQGRFVLRGLPPGEYELAARTPAHDRLSQKVRVPFDGPGKGTFYLRKRPYDPYETIIRAAREEERAVQRTLRLEEISRIPGVQGDALKVVQNLPGVARLPFGFGGLVIRGSGPQDSLAFLDGHPIPQLFHFIGLRSTFNSDILERIDFIPGNFNADYGRLMGGILDVATRPPKKDGVHGFVDVNLFDAGFLIEMPVGKGSIAASGRRSYIDAILPLVVRGSAADLQVAPRYYDYQVLFHYPLGAGHELKMMVFGSEDELLFLRDRPAGSGAADLRGQFRNNTLFHRLFAAWTYKSGGNFENRLSAAGGIDRFLLTVGDRFDIIRDVTMVSLREEARFRFSPDMLLSVGLDAQMGRERFGGKLPRIPKEGDSPRAILDDPTTGESRDNFLNPSLYASFTWKLGKLTLIPQLRWDYFSRVGHGSLDPRLTLRVDVATNTTIILAAGLYHQPPFFDELSPIFGNPNLDLQMAQHYSLGFSQRFTQATTLDVTGFYKNLSNLVVTSDTPVVKNGETVPERLSNKGRGEVFGLELLLRQQLYKGFFGWLGYTLMRSQRSNGEELPYRVFQFDQTHILTAIASVKFGTGWQMGFRWRFTTGYPRTPYIGALYDADADRYRPIPGAVLSERIPAFHQLDVRIDKEWAFERWKFSIYLDVQNAYNRANPEAVRYNFDFTQTTFITGLPLVPALGFRGEW